MKKVLFFAAAAMTLSACVMETATPVAGDMETITFEAEASAQTKTTIVDGTKVYWCAGDQISVMGAAAPFTNALEKGETAAKTAFTGEVATADTYYAVYPASAVKSWNGSVATLYDDAKYEMVTMRQPAVKGTFANGVNITAANTTTQEKSFSFKNVFGYVKMGLPAGIKTVNVTANGGESIWGKFSIDCADPAIVVSEGTGVNCVSLYNNAGIAEGEYYIALVPGTYAKGLTFDFVGTDGKVATKTISGPIELEVGHVNAVGTVSGLDWTDPAPGLKNAIWKGKFVSGNWDNGMADLAYGAYDWSKAKAGDTLRVHGGATDPNKTPTMAFKNKSWGALAGLKDYYNDPSAEMSVTLTEEAVAELKDGGLIIQGDAYYCTAIELVPGTGDPGQDEENSTVTLWEGSENLGTDWSTAVQIQGIEKIPYGAKLHVEYETPEGVGEGYYQVKFCYINAEWSWVQMESHLPYANEYGCITLTSGSSHFALTLIDEDVDAINNGNGLVVQGYAATITKVYYTIEDESEGGEIVLWEGEVIADDWTNQPTLISDAGVELIESGAKAGQTLFFYIEPLDSSWQLKIVEGHWGPEYAAFCSPGNSNNGEFTEYDLASNGGKIALTLTQEILDAALTQKGWGGGFVLNGDNVKCTKLTLL